MTFEQRLTAAKLLAGNDGIVCFVAGGRVGLTCGLTSAHEPYVMIALSAMHTAVVDCAHAIFNTLHGTAFPREHAEKMLAMLSASAVANGNLDMRIREIGGMG